MKKIGIMQPYLFPYIGYFQLINAVDTYVIYDDVQYIKNGWINRNNILISGKKNLFTIILDSTSPNKLIKEIQIVDNFKKFQKTIGMVYSKAPYKQPVAELINSICSYEDKNLANFIGNSLAEIMSYLHINTELIYSSALEKNNDLSGQDKVIAICEDLDAEIYVNSIGGKELYSKSDFADHNINLKFIQSNEIHYKQFSGEFIPNLSIIDVMMFNSVDSIRKQLEGYKLV